MWWRQWSVHVSAAASTALGFVGTQPAAVTAGTESADDSNDADRSSDASDTVRLHGGNLRFAGSGCCSRACGTRWSCHCHLDTLCRLRRMCGVPSHRHHH